LVERVNCTRPVEDFEQFQRVVGYLRELNIVQFLDKDLKGNHLIKLLQ
jgi:hypothetical protein